MCFELSDDQCQQMTVEVYTSNSLKLCFEAAVPQEDKQVVHQLQCQWVDT